MSAASGLIKVIKKGATAPAKAAPFYSAVDEVAQGLSRNKGTGKEFLREIEKTKGVKPAEIKDRKLDKVLNTDQKMTKDELVKVLEDNPPKQITEDIMGDITPEMIDQQIDELIEQEVLRELGPRPKLGYEREDWIDDYDRLIEQKNYSRDDYYQAAKQSISEDGGFNSEKYSEYKLPGGENYREILLKLPTFDPKKDRQLMQLEAYQRRGATNKAMDEELARLKAEKAAAGDEFRTPHWDQPNVLAHMRVQDRVGPNGEKVLHVEEIQSDWHQKGRDKGYTSLTPEEHEELRALTRKEVEDGLLPHDMARSKELEAKIGEVPDAPFKKNWHELAMKRLINYASENGYDKIAITPGAEQAKRYDLSKQLDAVEYKRNPDGGGTIIADDKTGNTVMQQRIDSDEKLSDYIGKEAAKKLLSQEPMANRNSDAMSYVLNNADLSVGGEGMKGFYDQILPAYLNKYGEKYGAKVGQLPISHGEKMIPDNAGLGMIRSGEPELTQLHSFDITPQMREEVLTKGQPLYQQIGIPAATGAAGAEMLPETSEEPGFAEGGAVNENTVPDMSDGGKILQGPPFKRGGKVSITNNPDAMFLELNDKKFRRK